MTRTERSNLLLLTRLDDLPNFGGFTNNFCSADMSLKAVGYLQKNDPVFLFCMSGSCTKVPNFVRGGGIFLCSLNLLKLIVMLTLRNIFVPDFTLMTTVKKRLTTICKRGMVELIFFATYEFHRVLKNLGVSFFNSLFFLRAVSKVNFLGSIPTQSES